MRNFIITLFVTFTLVFVTTICSAQLARFKTVNVTSKIDEEPWTEIKDLAVVFTYDGDQFKLYAESMFTYTVLVIGDTWTTSEGFPVHSYEVLEDGNRCNLYIREYNNETHNLLMIHLLVVDINGQ